MEKTQAVDQVFSFIFTGSGYQENYQAVFSNIAKNSEPYNEDVITAIFEVLTNNENLPASKFYALYLLVKATELQNKLFMNQLASSKDLLDNLFQTAQFNKGKPFGEKGKKIFSKQPNQEESLTGTNYLRLLLEAIKYWASTSESPNKQDLEFIYHVMYNTLSPRMEFPENQVYVGKSQTITDDFHLKQDVSQDKRVQIIEESFDKDDDSKLERAKPSLAWEDVNAAIASGDEFKEMYKLPISNQSKEYNNEFLKAIFEVLVSKMHTPMNKFYALYLLAKMTEFGKEDLINELAKFRDLLNKLFQDCQFDRSKSVEERGKKFFSKNPSETESLFGQYYLNLALECLYYWNEHYRIDDKTDPSYVFVVMYSTLTNKNIQFPIPLEYFGKDVEPRISIIETMINNEPG